MRRLAAWLWVAALGGAGRGALSAWFCATVLDGARRGRFSVLLGAAALAIALCVSPAAAQTGERPDFPRTTIGVDRGDGNVLAFRVEIAITGRQQAYGLMNLRALDADAGMLFIFPGERPRSFWMKNTFIPLDMLFFDAKGDLVSAIANVPPLSLKSRQSLGPAKYVLELNAGTMQRLGMGEDARLIVPERAN